MTTVNVKIKQLEERVATKGFFFGDAPAGKIRRKLEPGEVVELDMDDELTKQVLASGKVDVTLDPPTRPLDFDNENDAKYSSPSYRPRDNDDERDMLEARDRIAESLAPLVDEPEGGPTVADVEEVVAGNPRANRRRAASG